MVLGDDVRASLGEKLRDGREEAGQLGNEVSELLADLSRLASKEAELGKAEAQEQVSFISRGAMFGVLALTLADLALVFLFLTILFALDTAMALWTAALITTLIAVVLAAIAGFMAKSQIKKFSPQPRRLLRTLKEDVEWARNLTTSSVR